MALHLVEATPPPNQGGSSTEVSQIIETLSAKPGTWFLIGVFRHSAAAQRARRLRTGKGQFGNGTWTTRLHRIDPEHTELFGMCVTPPSVTPTPNTGERVGSWVQGQ